MITKFLDEQSVIKGESIVIREVKEWLAKMRHGRAGATPTVRKAVPRSWVKYAFEKQGFECAYGCGETDFKKMSGDHVEPLAKGGKHNRHNIVAACRKCNSTKGSRSILEFAKYRGVTLGKFKLNRAR